MKSENSSQCERNSAHNVGNKSKRRRFISCTQIHVVGFGRNGFWLSGSFGQARPQQKISSICPKYSTFQSSCFAFFCGKEMKNWIFLTTAYTSLKLKKYYFLLKSIPFETKIGVGPLSLSHENQQSK